MEDASGPKNGFLHHLRLSYLFHLVTVVFLMYSTPGFIHFMRIVVKKATSGLVPKSLMMVLPVVLLAVMTYNWLLDHSLRFFIRSYLLGQYFWLLIRADSIILALPEDYFYACLF